jgi:hypothetical protein
MNRFHPYDDRSGKRGVHDMGQGTRMLLPDNGKSFDRNTMLDIGFTLFQDFKHDDRPYQTRWWFRDVKTWKANIERIEQMGFEAIDKLTNT